MTIFLREQARQLAEKTGKSVSACRALLRRRQKGIKAREPRSPKNPRATYKWLAGLKQGKPCSICGLSYPPPCMDFHHRSVFDKRFSIGSGIRAGLTQNMILSEIEKCVLVCANCHRMVGRKPAPQNDAVKSTT